VHRRRSAATIVMAAAPVSPPTYTQGIGTLPDVAVNELFLFRWSLEEEKQEHLPQPWPVGSFFGGMVKRLLIAEENDDCRPSMIVKASIGFASPEPRTQPIPTTRTITYQVHAFLSSEAILHGSFFSDFCPDGLSRRSRHPSCPIRRTGLHLDPCVGQFPTNLYLSLCERFRWLAEALHRMEMNAISFCVSKYFYAIKHAILDDSSYCSGMMH
jgi:hypothetical protein